MIRQAQLVFAISFLCALPLDAVAHVKWFYPYDLTKPPLPIGKVITEQFTYMFLLSTACIYAFYWIDRYLYRRGFLAESLGKLVIPQDVAFWVMRIAASLVFLSLFVFGLLDSSFYLTPELKTGAIAVKWLHLVMAVAVLYRPIVPFTGIGIFVLYGLAISDYGLFHMLDYLIFLGIAIYFTFSLLDHPNWIKARYVTLYATTGMTLLWASIEKWGYPIWTYPLLAKDPVLLMGLTPEFYMLLAGFVEFNIAFILLSSVSVFSRFVAFGLNSIFILAIFKFGLIDAIGHLMIIAVLAILTARGPTSARYFLVLHGKSLWTEAYFMTGLYMLALNVTFVAYYGLYFLLH